MSLPPVSPHTRPEASLENLYRTFDFYQSNINLECYETAHALYTDIAILCQWLTALQQAEVLYE